MVRRCGFPVLLALLLAGCGGTDTTGTEPTTTPITAQTGTTIAPTETVRFRVYYLEGENLQAYGAEAVGEPTAQEAVEALVANEDGRATAIPEGTRVLGVRSGGGEATVDLSRRFESGGGSLSLQARVAQIVYTLTQWPWLERVTILLDGSEVEAIGGEGIPARQLERADFENVLPAIFVEAPLERDEVVSPLTVEGTARVFEANVSLRLESGAGSVLAETFATASEGAPGRGDFEAVIPFDVDEPTEGTLVAYEVSADDASEQRVVRVPVRLCPAAGC